MSLYPTSLIVSQLAPVAAPTLVSCLALHRLVRSRSVNRVIYATCLLISGLISILVFSDLFAAQTAPTGLAFAALTMPLAWIAVVRVTRATQRPMYDRPSLAPDRLASWGQDGTRTEAAAKTAGDPHTGLLDPSIPVFRTRNRVLAPKWGVALSPDTRSCVDGQN